MEWSGAQEALKTFLNLRLGETWKAGGESISPESLAARLEHDEAEVPTGVVVLVCAVDVQGDLPGDEDRRLRPRRGVRAHRLRDLPRRPRRNRRRGPSMWEELKAFRLREWAHASGAEPRPAITLVDSGDGNHVDSVYEHVQPRQGSRHRVYAV